MLSGAFRYVGGQPVRVAGQPQPQPMLALGGLLCIVGSRACRSRMQAGRFWDVWSVFPHGFDLGHISRALVCTYTAPDTQCRGASRSWKRSPHCGSETSLYRAMDAHQYKLVSSCPQT